MFDRRVIGLVLFLCLSLTALWWTWQEPAGVTFPTGQDIDSSQRWNISLNGDWEKYTALRQAWASETNANSEESSPSGLKSLLNRKVSFMLPSSDLFKVAVRRFRIPGEWSSRTMELFLGEVQGQATIYLNGIDNINKIGEIDGDGGIYSLEIPATALLYGEDNILLIQLKKNTLQRQGFLATPWPVMGSITGPIYLEAVVETSLSEPQVTVNWERETAQIAINADVVHHVSSEDGPWTVEAVLTDGTAPVAQQTVTLKSDDQDVQHVKLNLNVPNAHRWSLSDPFLYQVQLKLSNSQGDFDDLLFSLGLRSLEMSKGTWLLNGKAIQINGLAITPEQQNTIRNKNEIDSWLTNQRQKGINLIYFAGQLPSDLWLRSADKLGMAIWAELPVEGILESKLPDPSSLQDIINQAKLHPSVLALTTGKGLAGDKAEKKYLSRINQLVKPDLAFVLNSKGISSGPASSLPVLLQGNQLKGTWGSVSYSKPDNEETGIWSKEDLAAGIWAVIILFITLMNIRSANWRYIEIGERKPKRRLRNSWYWHGAAMVGRELTLAGIVTSAIYNLSLMTGPFQPHLLPEIEILRLQSPWLIWAALGSLLILIRLIQVGIVTPFLPESPHPLGLVYWLERRYRWNFIVALMWGIAFLGIPIYIIILSYFVLSLLFLPLRIRDMKRIGGNYRLLCILPMFFGLAVVVWGGLHWADWLYLVKYF